MNRDFVEMLSALSEAGLDDAVGRPKDLADIALMEELQA